MASSRVAKGLLWTAIGANVYVWAQWQNVAGAQAPKKGQDSHAQYMAQRKHAKYMNENYVLSSRNMAEGRWWTVITSAFSHYELTHLGINMLVLREWSLIVSPCISWALL